MEKTLTQEVSHEGNKFFLPGKDTIKEEGCPLDRGGGTHLFSRGVKRREDLLPPYLQVSLML